MLTHHTLLPHVLAWTALIPVGLQLLKGMNAQGGAPTGGGTNPLGNIGGIFGSLGSMLGLGTGAPPPAPAAAAATLTQAATQAGANVTPEQIAQLINAAFAAHGVNPGGTSNAPYQPFAPPPPPPMPLPGGRTRGKIHRRHGHMHGALGYSRQISLGDGAGGGSGFIVGLFIGLGTLVAAGAAVHLCHRQNRPRFMR
jgi:hypothetical protein